MRFVAFLVVSLFALQALSAEPREIPLKEIWAYSMPGTRNVQELEPKPAQPLSSRGINEFTERSNVWKVMKTLDRRPKEGERAGPAFVVMGTKKHALQSATEILTSGKEAKKSFPPHSDLSLVFYSYLCGRQVRLVTVEVSQKTILVKYQFVSNQRGIMSAHFALIPLGKLEEGTYEVKIDEIEAVNEQRNKVAPLRSPERFVSDSFSFLVRKE